MELEHLHQANTTVVLATDKNQMYTKVSEEIRRSRVFAQSLSMSQKRRINYKGKHSHFTLEKPGRHCHKQRLKVTSPGRRTIDIMPFVM